jgi:hypothetical protein
LSTFSILAILAGDSEGVPVHLARVDDGVAAAADVDEGGFHAGQHVLDAAQVDVPDQRCGTVAIDVVLHEDPVLEDGDLRVVLRLPNQHLPIEGLAPGQELGLGQDR